MAKNTVGKRQETFFWHDYETWGIRPSQDRPVQFAGLRSSIDGAPVGGSLNIFCKPTLDTLPHLEACLVTGITPQRAQAEGVSEREFFAAIHSALALPGTCALGYNSIRFDDEFTRFGLYRNFYDPYAREYKNGNSRWDLIDVVRSCYALRPNALCWPQREDGEASFKLDRLCVENGLAHEAAHDALSDVRATLSLAMLLREREPGLYAHLFKLRDKREAERALKLGSGQPRLHISARFPASQACASLILPLARHPSNKNEVFCADLRHSPKPLLDYSPGQLAQYLFTRTDALPDGIERIPLKSVHLNRSPVVLSTGLLDEPVQQRCAIDIAEAENHRQQLLAAVDNVSEKLRAMAVLNHFDDTGLDAEEKLYSGFIGDADRETLREIAALDGETLAARRFSFADTRLPEMLLRYRARNFPATLDQSERDEWLEYCRDKLLGAEAPLLAEIDKVEQQIAKNTEAGAGVLLASLREYLHQKKNALERGAIQF
ncbi:MAG: exodeoxyribonuclease I [Pseudomonadales bacterium]